jgi:integrase
MFSFMFSFLKKRPMSSLWKREHSPYWFCCYTAADGRRLKKSTKQRDRKRALEICLALERAEDMARKGTLTETRTRELIGEVLERTTGCVLPFHTAEGWLRHWLGGKERSKSKRTHTTYAHVIATFIAHLGVRAQLSITAVNEKDIAGFVDAQLASGKNPNTVRGLREILSIPFNAARRQGLLMHNPVAAVEPPAKAKTQSGEESSRDSFSPQQIEALVNAADKDWRLAILFSYFTGARLRDVANITWDAIDLPRKVVTYWASKTKKNVKVPLHPTLEEALLEVSAPDSGKAFVFPKMAGRAASPLSQQFITIMRRAGVRGEVVHAPKKGGEGRTIESLSFHSLRHSFNSAMANAGISQEVRMKLTGHTSAEMNKGYTHHELEPLCAAINSIPSPGRRKARK